MTPQDDFNFDEFAAPARLVYLADILRIPIPSTLVRMIPSGEVIKSIAIIGKEATAIELGIPGNQLLNIYNAGKGENEFKADEQEYRMIIAHMAESYLDLDNNLSFTKKLSKRVEISEFVNTKRSQLIEYEEVSLGNPNIDFKALELPTFNSGFQPLDMLLEGLAQTVIIFMARPGEGKTSTLLTIMGELRRTNACNSIWFFSLEMPLAMMLHRAQALMPIVKFKEDDRFFCGQYSPTDVLNKINEHPDPNRVIIYDNPDALGGGGDQRRFALEEMFRDLVQIKTNSKCVLTASQPRRADRGNLQIDSVAESWQKAWYSDVIITITDQGRGFHTDNNRLRMTTVKNRFGVNNRSVDYGYNYKNLTYTHTQATNEASGWGNPSELRDAVGDTRLTENNQPEW